MCHHKYSEVSTTLNKAKCLQVTSAGVHTTRAEKLHRYGWDVANRMHKRRTQLPTCVMTLATLMCPVLSAWPLAQCSSSFCGSRMGLCSPFCCKAMRPLASRGLARRCHVRHPCYKLSCIPIISIDLYEGSLKGLNIIGLRLKRCYVITNSTLSDALPMSRNIARPGSTIPHHHMFKPRCHTGRPHRLTVHSVKKLLRTWSATIH